MRIVVDKPPVYERCITAFGAKNIVGRAILWAWGDTIYNPLNVDIPRELMAHESVHGRRQGVATHAIEKWWNQYLIDPQFRFVEEAAAHQVEWQIYSKWHPGQNNAAALDHIAGKLASPLYGSLVDLPTARANVLLRV